jgi:hypothetical protein
MKYGRMDDQAAPHAMLPSGAAARQPALDTPANFFAYLLKKMPDSRSARGGREGDAEFLE